MNQNAILAIDYGTKHLGIALSDTSHQFATPLKTLRVNPQKAVKEVTKLIGDLPEQVAAILVGLPTGHGGKPTQMSLQIQKFITGLQQKSGINVVTWDETYSSKQAKNALQWGGDEHSRAATIMLQAYLDYLNTNV